MMMTIVDNHRVNLLASRYVIMLRMCCSLSCTSAWLSSPPNFGVSWRQQPWQSSNLLFPKTITTMMTPTMLKMTRSVLKGQSTCKAFAKFSTPALPFRSLSMSAYKSLVVNFHFYFGLLCDGQQNFLPFSLLLFLAWMRLSLQAVLDFL